MSASNLDACSSTHLFGGSNHPFQYDFFLYQTRHTGRQIPHLRSRTNHPLRRHIFDEMSEWEWLCNFFFVCDEIAIQKMNSSCLLANPNSREHSARVIVREKNKFDLDLVSITHLKRRNLFKEVPLKARGFEVRLWKLHLFLLLLLLIWHTLTHFTFPDNGNPATT